jgi:hypothetical protein
MKNRNPIERALDSFATLNPVPSTELPKLDGAPERARTLALIKTRRNAAVARTPVRRGRAAVAAIALATALAVPALAFSSQLGSLFGISNEGTSVDKNRLDDLRTATALNTAGASGAVKLLASRAGIGIYFAHGKEGKKCFFIGPPNGPDERGLSGGCMNAAASASFPSPAQPVVDMSAFFYRPHAVGEGITRLAGVAADGVAKMQVLGLDCQVIAEAPAQDNVYARSDLPDTPAVAIVGVGHDGQRVYLNKLSFWDKSACATRDGS